MKNWFRGRVLLHMGHTMFLGILIKDLLRFFEWVSLNRTLCLMSFFFFFPIIFQLQIGTTCQFLSLLWIIQTQRLPCIQIYLLKEMWRQQLTICFSGSSTAVMVLLITIASHSSPQFTSFLHLLSLIGNARFLWLISHICCA